MLLRSKDSGGGTRSIASNSMVADSALYEIDIDKLYECVLKIIILEYRNEARFRIPVKVPTSLGSISSASSSNSNNTSGYAKYYKGSSVDDSNEPMLPSYILTALENRLKHIALKKEGTNLDELTRRSLLRLYTELLDPTFKAEIARVNKTEYLLMKFVSCANKEMVKVQTIPQNEISEVVFKQASTFVQIVISLVKRDKDSIKLISKLEEDKNALKPNSKKPFASNNGVKESGQLAQASFRVSDMDQAMLTLIQNLFSVDKIKIQQDVIKFKDIAQQKALHKDIEQILFYMKKDLGQFTATDFESEHAYMEWKTREMEVCNSLLEKYQVPSSMKLVSIPQLPSGYDFYFFPPSSKTRSYFVTLTKMCINLDNKDKIQAFDINEPLLSKNTTNLLTLCSKFWRIDTPSKPSLLYTAAHLSGILRDDYQEEANLQELGSINVERSKCVLHTCNRLLEDNKVDFFDRKLWAFRDQDQWSQNLIITYNETFYAIKQGLQLIFNRSIKPKFSPLLQFLGEYIEADPLFFKLTEVGLPKKWEKKLTKTVLRASEKRYTELLCNLPRDDTLNIMHILDISDSIVEDVKMLQKRFKHPLLGFLNVSRTVAAVLTGMFAADSKNILKHIFTYAKNKNEHIPYTSALEVYKSLREIRSIYSQVSEEGSTFKFNLEKFFFPYIKSWVIESSEKIQNIVNEAINKDKYEPIDNEIDEKKYSSSVFDIFAIVKQYLKILKDLQWENSFQLAQVYTILLKSISDSSIHYCNIVTDKIIKELDEEELKKLEALENKKSENRKSVNWLDGVKNVVSNIQNYNKMELEEPYNFKPETCVALNNISAMMDQLSKLEEILDPEHISGTIIKHDPSASSNYTSHIFSFRVVRAENLKAANSSASGTNMKPYVTLIDTKARKTIGKTRWINNTNSPEWDEEFECILPAKTTLTLSVTVWDEKIGTHSICGRAMLQLDPRRFKNDGIPQEIFLDLDSEGRVLLEVAVESERLDALFVMGRGHRTLKRSQERCIKLIVEKFSRFIQFCFSRNNLRSICGNNGQQKPTQEQVDNAMMPLYDYLNMNLQVLAEYLMKDLLMKVMLAAWGVIISSADKLILPKLSSAKTFHLSSLGSKFSNGNNSSNWQFAVSSAVANVTNSMGITGFGKQLTNIELDTVFTWLNFLCFDFFHNEGNGPPVKDLKNEQYQALLLIPVFYDRDVNFLKQEVERLSPAFLMMLRDRNNFDSREVSHPEEKNGSIKRSFSRAGSIMRQKTIVANATAKARAKAEKDAEEARSDPIAAQAQAEDVILRLLVLKEEIPYVVERIEQREKLARSIATERLAREAALGTFSGI